MKHETLVTLLVLCAEVTKRVLWFSIGFVPLMLLFWRLR